MEDDRAAGYSQSELWEKNRELYLLLPQEKMPPNPAFAALAETNKYLDDLTEQGD